MSILFNVFVKSINKDGFTSTIRKSYGHILKILFRYFEFWNYNIKIKHNFGELSVLERLYWCCFDRHRYSSSHRYFFEGCKNIQGQMYISDRKALFDVIVEKKPKYCFEIGTFNGGGSTFFLASAFEKNGKGKVITMESYELFYLRAKRDYEKYLPHLTKHVVFLHSNNVSAFETFIKEAGCIECMFFDGAENSQETINQFRRLNKYFTKGTVLMFHDWNTDKMKEMRPMLEKSKNWKRINLIEPPESVGFSVYECLRK